MHNLPKPPYRVRFKKSIGFATLIIVASMMLTFTLLFLQSPLDPEVAAQQSSASSNANLRLLSKVLNEKIEPRFSPQVTEYTVQIPEEDITDGAPAIYLNIATAERGASLKVESQGRTFTATLIYRIPIPDFSVATVVTVTVTAPDGVTKKVYTLTTVPSNASTPTPTPPPTATPSPTATLVPTQTPVPTATPVPTETPVPTATPVPTHTPIPTATPPTVPTGSPTPTATIMPIATTIATPTAAATPTPALNPTPTETAIPIETPSATPTPTFESACLPAFTLPDSLQAGSGDSQVKDYPKLIFWLKDLAKEYDAAIASDRLSEFEDETVNVTVYTNETPEPALQFLIEHNVFNAMAASDMYYVYQLPVSLLGQLSELPSVIEIWPTTSETYTPFIYSDSAFSNPINNDDKESASVDGATVTATPPITNAAKWHGADSWHKAGYTGKGIKVGVIDRGFERFSRHQGDSKELPASVNARCYKEPPRLHGTSISDCERTTPDIHGTLVAEALMDIAPDAELYISNPRTQVELTRTVQWLIDNDVDVVNMSMSWLWEGPGDGTSVWNEGVLAAVEKAVENGIVWVNSAGNDNMRRVFHGTFLDSNQNGWLDFVAQPATRESESDGEKTATPTPVIDANEVLPGSGWSTAIPTLMLRWGSDPDDPDVVTDLDLYLCDDPYCKEVLEVGNTPKHLHESLIEYIFVDYISDGSYLRICHQSGANPEWVELGIFSPIYNLFYMNSYYTIGTPAESASSGMLAAGAASVSSSNATQTYNLADFSSRGPTTSGILKPDLVGTHGEVSAISGKRIYGTSLAAPHVAGLAALVIQQKRQEKLMAATGTPTVFPTEVVGFLKEHADIRPPEEGDPHFPNLTKTPTPDDAVNNAWGWGFAKLPSLTPTSSSSASLTLSSDEITVGESITVTIGTASPSTARFKLKIKRLSQSPCKTGQAVPAEDETSAFSTPKEFVLYGCWSGTGNIQLIRIDDSVVASGTVRVFTPTPISTATPSPTPIATPLPKASATLDFNQGSKEVGSIEVGDWVRITARNISPAGTEVYFRPSYHFRENRCPREGLSDADPPENAAVRTSESEIYYGCEPGIGRVILYRSADNEEIARKTIRITDPPPTATPIPTNTPVPTATPTKTPTPRPTATPTATPTPRVSATLVFNKDSIETGDWVRITARNITPSGTKVYFRPSYHFREGRCPREGLSDADPPENAAAQTSVSKFYYGCEPGIGRVILYRSSDNEEIARKSIRITDPPPTATPTPRPTSTPRPTATPTPVPPPKNLRYAVGTTWINFVWDAPTGYNTFLIWFNGSSRTITRNSHFESGLNRGTPYYFRVSTKASDGRTSRSVGITVETECGSLGSACAVGARDELLTSFGDGILRVDVEIAAGTYAIGNTDTPETCEWERLRNLKGTADQVIESGSWSAGKRVTIASSDAAFRTSGCGTWTKVE